MSDERGLISTLFIWSLVGFLLLGLVLNEVGQCVVAKTRASNAAEAASDAGEEAYKLTRNPIQAKAAAVQAAADESTEGRVTQFSIGRDGSVTVTVQVTASTIIIKRVSAMKGLGVYRSTATAKPVSG